MSAAAAGACTNDGAVTPKRQCELPTKHTSHRRPQVGRVLGTGSFGRVSLARHRASGRVCAIKALSKAHIVKSQQVAVHKAGCDTQMLQWQRHGVAAVWH